MLAVTKFQFSISPSIQDVRELHALSLPSAARYALVDTEHAHKHVSHNYGAKGQSTGPYYVRTYRIRSTCIGLHHKYMYLQFQWGMNSD